MIKIQFIFNFLWQATKNAYWGVDGRDAGFMKYTVVFIKINLCQLLISLLTQDPFISYLLQLFWMIKGVTGKEKLFPIVLHFKSQRRDAMEGVGEGKTCSADLGRVADLYKTKLEHIFQSLYFHPTYTGVLTKEGVNHRLCA